MTASLSTVMAMVAASGSGLMAGIFFAFSSFVMRALARLEPSAGIAAMQSINRAVLNALFMSAFFGAEAACLFLIPATRSKWQESCAHLLLAGSTIYLVGGIGVTMVCNVPLNRALAEVEPADRDRAARWDDYVRRWTAWNHARTIACLAASALSTLGGYCEAAGRVSPQDHTG
ncbi:MAG TPA: anthrone oxygenase family protein [Alphaproteobacteria bacterium]|nr:anthrone oxygenase family protein [Alphaproteobacteria bacterium]